MHISLVISTLPGGGAERVTLAIATELADRGHRVDIVLLGYQPVMAYRDEIPAAAHLVVLCSPEEWADWIDAGIPETALWLDERMRLSDYMKRVLACIIREMRAWRLGQAVRLFRYMIRRRRQCVIAGRVLRYMERERPDIVFSNLPVADYAALFAAYIAGRPSFPPVVPVIHNVEGPNLRHIARMRLLLPAAAHVVAVSRGVAQNVNAVLGVPVSRVSSIYNPAFTPKIVCKARKEPSHAWFRDGGPPVVLGVGRLALQKDFITLIEAFRRVRAERPCRLVILGEGPMRGELEGRVRALGLTAHVSLPGWAENPYAFMARAALFVLSSRHEGFGNVLVEALACGCPAVSTDCPAGPAEILEDPTLLAPVGDPEALAQVMLHALARPADRAALRAKATRFSAERAVVGYEEVVERVLRGRVGSASPVSHAPETN